MSTPSNLNGNIAGKDIPSINIFKFFFALCVVMAHTTMFHDIFDNSFCGQTIHYICHDSVPFFFTVGGYFLTKKIKSYLSGENTGFKPLMKYWRKMLVLYIFWCCSRYLFQLICGTPFQSSIYEAVRWFFLIGYNVYWYIWAIICFIPLYLIFTIYYRRCGKPSDFLSMVSIILILLMLYNGCEFVEIPDFLLPIKWFYFIQSNICRISMILYGFIFFMLGGYFAMTHRNILTPLSSILFIICGYIIVYWPGTIGYLQIEYIGRLLSVYGVFSLALTWKPEISHQVSLTMRKMSAWIYFTHPFVISLYAALFSPGKSAVSTIVVFVLCISCAFLITKIAKTPYFKWLEKLI